MHNKTRPVSSNTHNPHTNPTSEYLQSYNSLKLKPKRAQRKKWVGKGIRKKSKGSKRVTIAFDGVDLVASHEQHGVLLGRKFAESPEIIV